jgi:hypothetical protein
MKENRDEGHVHPAYNPSFSAYFFSRNNIFLSQQISQRCFSASTAERGKHAYQSSSTCALIRVLSFAYTVLAYDVYII